VGRRVTHIIQIIDSQIAVWLSALRVDRALPPSLLTFIHSFITLILLEPEPTAGLEGLGELNP
jgi:hypothetical protein